MNRNEIYYVLLKENNKFRSRGYLLVKDCQPHFTSSLLHQIVLSDEQKVLKSFL